MTFAEAMKAHQGFGDETVKVSRPYGPVFWVDSLGKIVKTDQSSAYVADYLDFDDWTIEAVPDDNAN